MRTIMKRSVVLLVALLVVGLAPALAHAKDGKSPLMPPQSHAFGKSFEQWNMLQTQWAIASGLGGDTKLSDTVGKVRLLPGSFVDRSPVFNITLRPGTPFVASPFFVFGERYDDPAVPDDDPEALEAFLDQDFATTKIKTVLDGRVLLDGTGSELKHFWFGPAYFAEPIVYATPVPRGENLNAVAALWVRGIGSVYHPLPVGKHTLVYRVQSEVFGDFHFTYHLKVSPH